MAQWKTKQTALLLDPESKVAKLYGAKNTPNMVVINPEGKIVYEGAIDSKASPNPADIPSSTNYVRTRLMNHSAQGGFQRQTKPYGCHITYKSSKAERVLLTRSDRARRARSTFLISKRRSVRPPLLFRDYLRFAPSRTRVVRSTSA